MSLDTILSRVVQSGEIPTIGAVAAEVMRLAGDPDTEFRQVGRVIAQDPSLTARVLQVANSPYFGTRGEVAGVDRAVALMGMEEVRNIVLSVSVISDFSGTFGGQTFNWERFWEHSSGCALIAQVFAKLLRLPTAGEEFVAGLLHDVGKIVLGHHFPEEFSQALELAASEGVSMAEAEQRVFGTDHTHLGRWLAERWSFPASIQVALGWHHRVAEAPDHHLLAAVVHLADLFAKVKQIGFGGDFVAVCLADDPAWEVVGAGQADLDLERFTFQLDREVEAARQLLRMAGRNDGEG
jgi:HD-like signal output (HDOD) protein